MNLTKSPSRKKFLIASDFDQTLSFNDSGEILSAMLDQEDFAAKVAGLSGLNLVQQGAELAYLILHDPVFRGVNDSLLRQVGRRVRLKANISKLVRLLADGIEGNDFHFVVISAAPESVVESALEGAVAPERIFGTRLQFEGAEGPVASVQRVAAGHGKVAVLEEIRCEMQVSQDKVIYIGDGSSDIHVMHHVNHHGGLTVGVSESGGIPQVAQRTILSDDTLSVLVPVLQEVFGFRRQQVRHWFESRGVELRQWERGRTDWISIHSALESASVTSPEGTPC